MRHLNSYKKAVPGLEGLSLKELSGAQWQLVAQAIEKVLLFFFVFFFLSPLSQTPPHNDNDTNLESF